MTLVEQLNSKLAEAVSYYAASSISDFEPNMQVRISDTAQREEYRGQTGRVREVQRSFVVVAIDGHHHFTQMPRFKVSELEIKSGLSS